jgi:membrane protein required for colicin V production
MSLFDLAAGLVLIVSVLVGWMRGAAREVATVAALVIAAVVALFALRFSGPVARHAIHTPWLANIAAILIVFAAIYIMLRVMAGALTRRIHQTSALGGIDRMVGAGFGAARALVLLGLANLTINAIMPPDRMPPWISGALLYPVSSVSASALKAFAPRGADLAKQVYPVVGKAITSGGQDNEAAAADAQNRDYNDPQTNAPGPQAPSSRPAGLRVEKTP